jgi:hypothetical protein
VREFFLLSNQSSSTTHLAMRDQIGRLLARLLPKLWGPARHAPAQRQGGLVQSEERWDYLTGWHELITGGANSRASAIV